MGIRAEIASRTPGFLTAPVITRVAICRRSTVGLHLCLSSIIIYDIFCTPNFLDGNMMTERGDVHHCGGRATLFLGYAGAHGVWLTEPSRDERHGNAGSIFKKHKA